MKGTWQSQGARPPEGLLGSLLLGLEPSSSDPRDPVSLSPLSCGSSLGFLKVSVAGLGFFFLKFFKDKLAADALRLPEVVAGNQEADLTVT